jgi:putative endonuclease
MPKSKTEKGNWGEDIAEQFLRKKGFNILHRNWRCERGDIDIVAMDKNCLVFVEVKSGSTEIFGPPELRITDSKKRRLYKLASLFLQRAAESQLANDSNRFDVVIVDGTPNKYVVRHYENAFYI